MDVSGRVLVERHRLKENVLGVGFGLRDVDQLEEVVSLLEYVRVALLADLAFEFLPVVRGDVLTVFLLLAL